MNGLIKLKNQVVGVLNPAGDWVALLPIRLLMAYEFGTAGMMKFNGKNWFDRFQFQMVRLTSTGSVLSLPVGRRCC